MNEEFVAIYATLEIKIWLQQHLCDLKMSQAREQMMERNVAKQKKQNSNELR